MKRMTAKKRLLVVFIAAVAVGATVALVFIFQFFGDAVRERSDLYISARTDYPGLLDSLRPRTDHHWAFDRYAGRLELERSFKPGHYVLEPGMNVVEIARMLKLGMQTPVRVTLNYARTRAFLASRLARQLDADSAELMRALTDPQLAREVGTDSLQLFSIFIPNTYEFYWTVSPEDFVRRMRKEYDRFWTPERDAARRRSGLSRDDAGFDRHRRDQQGRRNAPCGGSLYQPPAERDAPAGRSDGQICAAGFFASPDSAQALENPFAV